MKDELRKAQAEHFDSHSPFIPASSTLRITGFRYSYILKDRLISQLLHRYQPAPGSRVLDVGCGRGIFLDRLAATYDSVGYGVDISKVSVKRLQSDSVHPQVGLCAEGEQLPFKDACFDMAVTFDVLEHVEIPEQLLAEMLRVLKPEGRIIFYAVSRRNRFTLNWFMALLFEVVGVNHWAWIGHAPERLVDPLQIAHHLRQLSCNIRHLEPFHAFFTILFDQSVLVLYWLAERICAPRRLIGIPCSIPLTMLRMVSALCSILLEPLARLDRPWVTKMLSNGFLCIATGSDSTSARH